MIVGGQNDWAQPDENGEQIEVLTAKRFINLWARGSRDLIYRTLVEMTGLQRSRLIDMFGDLRDMAKTTAWGIERGYVK